MYFTEAREATPNDRLLAEVVTQTAAVIISSFVNINERQQAEEALRKSDERYRLKLEQEVQERTLELNKSQEELSEKNNQLNYIISKLESFNYLASHDLREIFNAILYVNRTGIAWRYLPHDLPPWQTVYGYYTAWTQEEIFVELDYQLTGLVRDRTGRHPSPVRPSWTAGAPEPPSTCRSPPQASTPTGGSSAAPSA